MPWLSRPRINNAGGYWNTRHVTAPGGVQRLLIPFARPFMKAPGRGAATSIHLVSAPDLEQVTGRYFASSKPRRSSRRSYDQAAAARLWQASADLTGLTAVGAATSAGPAGRTS